MSENDFTAGQQALIERTAYAVVKADRSEHVVERKQEMILMVTEIMVNVRAEIGNHEDKCRARKYSGRLRVWVPVAIGSAVTILLAVGVVNFPTILKLIALLTI